MSRPEAPGALASRVAGPVHVIGTGLLGASIGLALREKGIEVTLDDASPTSLSLAIDYGAGRALAPGDAPQTVVVAVPPDVTALAVERALLAFPNAVVTDVASVKLAPFEQLTARGVDLTNYIGSHPMAGRERGGAIMARTDLFVGRPWVICRDGDTPAAALSQVEALALELGATPARNDPPGARPLRRAGLAPAAGGLEHARRPAQRRRRQRLDPRRSGAARHHADRG